MDSGTQLRQVRNELVNEDENEISFIELWMILVKRWQVVGAIFVLSLVAGLIVAVFLPTKYLFSTTIEIGSLAEKNGELSLIEAPQIVQIKLKDTYIPYVLSEMDASDSTSAVAIDINATVSGTTVIISSFGQVSDADKIRELHLSVVGLVVDDHNSLIELRRRTLEQEQAFIQDQINLTQTRGKDLEKIEEEMLENLNSLELERNALLERIAEIGRDNQRILGDSSQENFMFKALMASQELDRNERRLLAIENRIYVATPQVISRNKAVLVDQQRYGQEYQVSLGTIKSALFAMTATRTAALLVKASKPSGIGKITIVLLFGVLGLFAGVFAAFFCEFVSKVNKTMSRSNNV